MQKRLTEQGLRFLEEGQFDKAVQILSLLIKSFPDNADAHHMLGIIELERGDFEAAYILVNTAIDLVQDNPMFRNTLGNIELHRKNYDKAEKAFLSAINLDPQKIEYKYNLAHFYLTQNKYAEAIDYYYYILHTNPTHYLSIRGITVSYLFSEEIEIALEHANEWVREYNNYDEAYYYQGLCLYALNNITGALAAYDKGLELAPTNHDILTAIGACYRALGNFNIAETYLHNSLRLDSNNATAVYHLACIKLDKGELNNAHDLFINAIALDNFYAEPVCGLGSIELIKGNEESALDYFNRASIVEPLNTKSKALMACTLLKIQRFKEGWAIYNKNLTTRAAFKAIPTWKGESLNSDQVLLVWTSNKSDDLSKQLLFSSMLVDLKSEVKRVIVLCDRRLVKLLRRSLPELTIISEVDNKDLDCNAHCITHQIALSALGQYYRLNASDFNRAAQSFRLAIDPARHQYYTAKYKQLFPNKKLIGISWKANTNTNAIDHHKSSHLSAWQHILSKNSYQFISLQPGDIKSAELYVDPDPQSYSPEDLAEVGAQMSALDLVITVDNHIAHLAGNLNIDAYAIIPLQAEWYWFNDKAKSTIYPSMRLFKQANLNDWSAPLQELAKKL